MPDEDTARLALRTADQLQTDIANLECLPGILWTIGPGGPRTKPNRQAVGTRAMADRQLRQLVRRGADQLDYLLTLARLRILDALAGPLPETPADRRREGELVGSPRSTVIDHGNLGKSP